MKINPVTQGTPEWHEFRRNGIGSTDIAAIMNKSPYKNAKQVFEDKIGVSEPIFENEHMRRGSASESVVQEWLRNKLDVPSFLAPCIESEDFPCFRSSLDFYSEEKGIIAEIKVPSDKNFLSRSCHQEAEIYQYQLQWHMLVSGMDRIYFVRYSPTLDTFEFTLVLRDEELIVSMKEAALTFWDNLKNGIMPQEKFPVLSVPETVSACEEYARLIKEKLLMDPILKGLREEILSKVQGNCIQNGIRCNLSKGRVSYDYAAMKDDGIDIEKYILQGKEFYTLKDGF